MPDTPTTGAIGSAAIAANLLVAGLLWRFRDDDANMVSVWICTRNDVIGNIAVLVAVLGVFGTGGGWTDLAVSTEMSQLALSGA